jgi:hypothetical protein
MESWTRRFLATEGTFLKKIFAKWVKASSMDESIEFLSGTGHCSFPEQRPLRKSENNHRT